MKTYLRATCVKDGEIVKETIEVEGYKEALVEANRLCSDGIVVVSVDVYHT